LGRACYGPTAIGARRLRVLIQHLPPESSLARTCGWWWTDVHEMQAVLIEIAYVTAQGAGAAAAGISGKRFKPEQFHVPRPHDAEAAPPEPFTIQSVRDQLLNRGR